MKKFTEEELSRYNGESGKPIYLSCKGLVYDLSSSFLWKNGKHQVLHRAGADLTNNLDQAPHGMEVFDKFPIVGILLCAEMSNRTSKNC